MPEICRFFGIIISLYWKDHNPPHIHFLLYLCAFHNVHLDTICLHTAQ